MHGRMNIPESVWQEQVGLLHFFTPQRTFGLEPSCGANGAQRLQRRSFHKHKIARPASKCLRICTQEARAHWHGDCGPAYGSSTGLFQSST